MASTRNFADVIRAKLRADADLAEAVEQESFRADLARQVYKLRTAAGMTQPQLAEQAGLKPAVIAQLEEANFDGRSLTTLWRIARALGQTLRVEFAARTLTVDTGKVGRSRGKANKNGRVGDKAYQGGSRPVRV